VSNYVYDYANDMPIAKLAFMHAVTPTTMLVTTPTTMSMVTFSGYAHNYTPQLCPKATPTNSFMVACTCLKVSPRLRGL